jgi:hypothetical protein
MIIKGLVGFTRKFIFNLLICLFTVLVVSVSLSSCANSQSVGTVKGTVYDINGVGVPNANVSLWKEGHIVNMPYNPLLANDGRTAKVGQFTINNVPAGQYTIIAGKGDKEISKTITVTSANVSTVDLIIKDYVYIAPAPYIPKPTVTIAPTSTLNLTPSQTVTPSPSNNNLFSGGFLLGALTTMGIIIILGFGIFIGITLKKK